ncbi:MAG: cytidylate kinase family protein [Blautia sp.]|nr:cytidylate kinase family protein [Blautia sp.]
MTNLLKRLLVFCLGQFVLACGVVLAIKANLGASPTTAIPNVIYNILQDQGNTAIALGTCTTAIYCVYILVQLILLRRDFKVRMLLEIAVSFIFGYFVTLGQHLLAFVPAPQNYFIQIVYLVISIPIMSAGIAIYVIPQISPAPAEGVTAALSQKIGWPVPRCLLVFDICIVSIGVILSLVYFHGLVGIREGTIICAFTLGPVMKPIMNAIEKPLTSFCGLKTKTEAAMENAPAPVVDPGKLIITIDWEFSSCGDLLARSLAEKLGAKIYSNDELVEMEIKESGLPERFVTIHERLMRHSAIYDYATYAYRIQQSLDPLEQLYAAQVSVLRQIAATEKAAVILGHCGNYILRDDPNCFKLFVHADTDDRVRWAVNRNQTDAGAAKQAMTATDHSRAKYHHDFTGEMWGQAKNYDLTLSTSSFSKPKDLELICDAIEYWKSCR